MTQRTERTRQRISSSALQLFAERGFDAVTVNEIAATAGVSHMTVFRHFATKEDMVVSDPFDPLIAASVATQPTDLSPFERARRGILAAWDSLPAENAKDLATLTLRLRLISTHSGLRARMWETTHATTQAVAAALREGGAAPLVAEAAAGACIGALTAALLVWAEQPTSTFSEAMQTALGALAGQG